MSSGVRAIALPRSRRAAASAPASARAQRQLRDRRAARTPAARRWRRAESGGAGVAQSGGQRVGRVGAGRVAAKLDDEIRRLVGDPAPDVPALRLLGILVEALDRRERGTAWRARGRRDRPSAAPTRSSGRGSSSARRASSIAPPSITACAPRASPSRPPTMTSRSLVEAGSNADGFSIVSSGVSPRVMPAALTMRGSPGSAASARKIGVERRGRGRRRRRQTRRRR